MMLDDKLVELFCFYTKIAENDFGHSFAEKLDDAAYVKSFSILDAYDDWEFWQRAPELRQMACNHAAWMAGEAIGFVKEAQRLEGEVEGRFGNPKETAESVRAHTAAKSKREKAMRWLGFIQGVLWMSGTFTLDELKEHSRGCSDNPEAP